MEEEEGEAAEDLTVSSVATPSSLGTDLHHHHQQQPMDEDKPGKLSMYEDENSLHWFVQLYYQISGHY